MKVGLELVAPLMVDITSSVLAWFPDVVASMLVTGLAVLPKARAVGELVELRAGAGGTVSEVAFLRPEPIGTNVHPPCMMTGNV